MLRFLLQEFAQQKGLLREPLGTRVFGKKIKKLVPKYRRAARLEHHDWHPGFDLGSKRIQSPQQLFLGSVQHAAIIKRSAPTLSFRRTPSAFGMLDPPKKKPLWTSASLAPEIETRGATVVL